MSLIWQDNITSCTQGYIAKKYLLPQKAAFSIILLDNNTSLNLSKKSLLCQGVIYLMYWPKKLIMRAIILLRISIMEPRALKKEGDLLQINPVVRDVLRPRLRQTSIWMEYHSTKIKFANSETLSTRLHTIQSNIILLNPRMTCSLLCLNRHRVWEKRTSLLLIIREAVLSQVLTQLLLRVFPRLKRCSHHKGLKGRSSWRGTSEMQVHYLKRVIHCKSNWCQFTRSSSSKTNTLSIRRGRCSGNSMSFRKIKVA